MAVLLWQAQATDYLDDRYRIKLLLWLRTLSVDPHDARRIEVWRVGIGFQARINEYLRDHEGRLVVDDRDRPRTRDRIVPLNAANWPHRPEP